MIGRAILLIIINFYRKRFYGHHLLFLKLFFVIVHRKI